MAEVIFQGDPTGVADSYPVMVQTLNQLAAAGVNASNDGRYKGTDKLIIRKGRYRFSNTIELKACTYVSEGEGSGSSGGEATVLRFAPGKHGFILQKA